jgi:hypothetical protein
MAMRKSQASRTVLSNEIQNEESRRADILSKSFSIYIKARYISFLEEICVRFVA